MGGTASKSTPTTPQSPNESMANFITPKYEVVNTTPKSNDIFRQCNSEVASIQKSQSQSRISIHNELQKSTSKSKFLDNVREKKEIERKREESVRRERSASQAKIDAENMEIRKKRQDSESRKTSVVSPTPTAEKKPINNEPKSKLDQIFGGLRDAPAVQQAPQTIAVTSVYTDPDFDPGLKEVKGMTESVKLKKSTKKPVKEEPKKEKIKFELPAKKPKPKQKAKEAEPAPPPKEPEPAPTPKEPTPPSLVKEAEAWVPWEPTNPPPKEQEPHSPSPSPPPLKSPSPAPPPVEEEVVTQVKTPSPRISPTKLLPPKIGINGFNGVGRLVLRAAMESGLDVRAINEPFVPLNYMVYMLKFDIAHQSQQYHGKEMSVRESVDGKLIVNGSVIHVLSEHDVTKIPWELVGVNYVVEATDALNSKAEAGLHIRKGPTKGKKNIFSNFFCMFSKSQ